jgi:hypothetical protein
MGIAIASGVLAVVLAVAAFRVVASRKRRDPLGHCPICEADAVSVLDRERLDEVFAELELRCGACGTWRRVRTSSAAAQLLEHKLERQCRWMRDLDRERMASETEAFVAALRSEIEGADDFLAHTQVSQA